MKTQQPTTTYFSKSCLLYFHLHSTLFCFGYRCTVLRRLAVVAVSDPIFQSSVRIIAGSTSSSDSDFESPESDALSELLLEFEEEL